MNTATSRLSVSSKNYYTVTLIRNPGLFELKQQLLTIVECAVTRIAQLNPHNSSSEGGADSIMNCLHVKCLWTAFPFHICLQQIVNFIISFLGLLVMQMRVLKINTCMSSIKY